MILWEVVAILESFWCLAFRRPETDTEGVEEMSAVVDKVEETLMMDDVAVVAGGARRRGGLNVRVDACAGRR